MSELSQILPAPTIGENDWPWSPDREAAQPFGPNAPNGEPWPRISMVTPSYNQRAFLEKTIRSVLLQGYPSLEYLVIDGGSTDGSVEILEKYSPWLSYWVSEKDRGQSHAINKGLARATGEILGWLNSDDWLMPSTLRVVAENLHRGTGHSALVGHITQVNVEDNRVSVFRGEFKNLFRLLQFWKGYRMHQPSIFWRREVFDRVGLLDENLHYIMDFDYWARTARHFDFLNVDQPLSCAHKHVDAKTWDGGRRWREEAIRERHRYWKELPAFDRLQLEISFRRWRIYQGIKGAEKVTRRFLKMKLRPR